jgi:hypothetical protein
LLYLTHVVLDSVVAVSATKFDGAAVNETSAGEQEAQPSDEQAKARTAEDLGFRPLPLRKPRLRGRSIPSGASDPGADGGAVKASSEDSSP